MTDFAVRYGDHVQQARRAGRPVVALESTIVSHGLPRPDNLRVAREIEAAVREHGAVPATVGMVDGRLTVGLTDPELELLAGADGVAKLSVRDLAPAAARRADGATTVAATSAVAAAAGIGVFATGGLGGVHREPWDESADLHTLARTPITVVCAGVKSILDVGATLERLETLGVAVAGYRTDRFPGFLVTDSGFDLEWRLDSPAEVAAAMAAREAHGVSPAALVLANPVPPDQQLDPARHDEVLASGLALLAERGVTGKRVTPFLLAHFHDATRGESLAVNVRAVLGNAALAAQVAVAAAEPVRSAGFALP